MTGNTRVLPAEITGVKGVLMKRVVAKMLDRVPAPLGVFWHNPAVLKASFAIGQKFEKAHACDRGLKSFAHMAVASLIGCTWCLDRGYFEVANKDLDLDGEYGFRVPIVRVGGTAHFG
ncbi:hypothetical protein [Arthrobacter sp. KK5.5]|uniref:hypothetical protein n=1 Tax=Arthrobacter sp. KK5.5 TaxID=3373084 RepID=UPI003EE7466F